MLKITLVDVGTPRDELNEPLGIEVLAGTLRHRFSSSVTVHLEYLQLSNGVLLNEEVLMDVHLIGISASLYSLKRAQTILNKIHSIRYPTDEKPLVVLGNLLGTFAYKEMLRSYKEIICVRGEGEDALCSIVQNLLDFPSGAIQEIRDVLYQRDVPNIAFIDGEKIIETTRRLVNLEKSVKPARDFLPLIIQRKGIVLVEASRGCPWGLCKFCAICAKYGDAKWRPFPVNRIVEELEELSLAGARSPYYTDEDFIGSDPERAVDVANKIILAKEKSRIDKELNFYVNMAISGITGDKKRDAKSCIAVLKRLKEAGLREVFIGIESGARSQISRYRKKATAEKNIEGLTILRDLDLTIDMGFIMFDPEMTLSDLKENLDFIKKADLMDHDARYIKKVRVEPGTELEEELRAKKIIGIELDVNSLTYPYKFNDSLVQKIFDGYKNWEKDALEVVYSIQGRSRGEISSEEERNELKRFLGKFRRLDFEILETCISTLEKSPEDFDGLERVEKTFQEKRSRLIEEVPKYLSLHSKN